MTLQESYRRCTDLAQAHYENFPVGLLVPRHKQPHVHAIYAFARVSDDIADEGYADPREAMPRKDAPTPAIRTEQMKHYREQLENCLADKPVDPAFKWIFLPLKDTMEKLHLPAQLFFDLLSAFQQDIDQCRYDSFSDVLDYCRRSANPIGRLVLHLHDIRDDNLHELSDHICTALQLANFWQDVSVDLGKDRIYLPQEDLKKFDVQEKDLFGSKVTQEFLKLMEFQVERTQGIFDDGVSLPRFLPFRLSWEIRMTWLGGTSILKKIRQQKYNTLSKRPKLTKLDMLCMGLQALIRR
ncbi:MAG: squalene synthase HpnC [Verrucomicrobiota bacterium]